MWDVDLLFFTAHCELSWCCYIPRIYFLKFDLIWKKKKPSYSHWSTSRTTLRASVYVRKERAKIQQKQTKQNKSMPRFLCVKKLKMRPMRHPCWCFYLSVLQWFIIHQRNFELAARKTHFLCYSTAETVYWQTKNKKTQEKRFNLFFTAHFMYKRNLQKAIQNKTKCIKHIVIVK